MTFDPNARPPEPDDALAQYAGRYVDDDYLARTDPLRMLRLGENLRLALRRYDRECVRAARKAGATWQEIGEAVGMARQNAQRKFGGDDA